MEGRTAELTLTCPVPVAEYPQVLLAHGGGRLMHTLIEKMFMTAFRNPALEARHDGAVCRMGGVRFAFTTDSYVVRPLFFPGGDIGSLAVHGTVNDLAMCGARPLFISAGLILEEGLPMETLWRVVQSMRRAAEASGVEIVTGDTKVVDRGKGDGIFINTSGVGILDRGVAVAPSRVRPGDALLLNGDIGRHGIAIMAVREGLSFEGTVTSDSAPLAPLVGALLDAGVKIHCMRDLTRGGLAGALVEIARAGGVRLAIEERAIPVREDVRGACEILGLDPLYVANEGRFVAFVAPADVDRALRIMRVHPLGAEARVIGRVAEPDPTGTMTMETEIGVTRVVDMLSGEQLPRIC